MVLPFCLCFSQKKPHLVAVMTAKKPQLTVDVYCLEIVAFTSDTLESTEVK